MKGGNCFCRKSLDRSEGKKVVNESNWMEFPAPFAVRLFKVGEKRKCLQLLKPAESNIK